MHTHLLLQKAPDSPEAAAGQPDDEADVTAAARASETFMRQAYKPSRLAHQKRKPCALLLEPAPARQPQAIDIAPLVQYYAPYGY